MPSADSIPTLLAIAWLLPLASFTVIVLAGRALGRTGKFAGVLATGAIVSGFALSLISLVIWLGSALPMLLILILIKTFLDMRLHEQERGKLSAAQLLEA